MAPLPGLAELVSTRAYTCTTLLGVDDLSANERSAVPEWVLESVAHEGPEGVVAATAHWEDTLPGALGDASRLFRDRAVGTSLGRVSGDWGGFLVLIYVLRGDTEPFVCWYGYLPTNHLDNRTEEESRPGEKTDLTQVSERLRAFYTQIHNRFRLIGAGECGLAPLDELFTLEGEPDDFDHAEDIDPPAADQLLPVFISSNGRLCVELGTENAWLLNGASVEPVGELWPNINAWIRRSTEARL